VNCARAVNRELIQIHELVVTAYRIPFQIFFCALSSLKMRNQRYISTMSRVVEELRSSVRFFFNFGSEVCEPYCRRLQPSHRSYCLSQNVSGRRNRTAAALSVQT
jgi:hypothetical protein